MRGDCALTTIRQDRVEDDDADLGRRIGQPKEIGDSALLRELYNSDWQR